MKLHRLDVCGFGPFRERQSVDFEQYATDGIFLIAGRTGAGKSSILDAICYALYGSVPRFTSSKARLRSDHCQPGDPSEVIVEFSTAAGRYRVTRAPEYERPSKRATGGMTTVKETAVLERWQGESWVGVAAKPRDVGIELGGILQLSRDQFLQVILLAQNRFAEFLLADSKKRRELLRQLFGSHRFETIQDLFTERRRASEAALGNARTAVMTRLDDAESLVNAHRLDRDDTDDSGAGDESGQADAVEADTAVRFAALDAALERATVRATVHEKERETADAAATTAAQQLTAAQEIAKAQAERAVVTAEWNTLVAAQPDIDRAITAQAQAEAAELLRLPMHTRERAERDHADAITAEASARSAWADAAGPATAPETDAAALRTWADEQRTAAGAWQAARDLEAQAAVRRAALTAAERERDDAQRLITERAAERDALPARIDELSSAADDAAHAQQRVSELTARRDEAVAREKAAQEAETLSARLRDAERARLDAQTALEAAEAAVTDVLRRRFDGMAGELATSLTDGDPCPVCGAREHPAPAEQHDPVSADDVAAAEQARGVARDAEQAAAARVADVHHKHAAAHARAAERSHAEATAERQAADAALAKAHATARTAADLVAQRDTARARLAALDEERVSLTARHTAAEGAVRSAHDEIARADATIATARGDFDTVADRLTYTLAQVGAAIALCEAIEHRQRADTALTQARADYDEALAASPFDDAAAVQSALRTAAERADLAQRIDTHAQRCHTAQATLQKLSALALPDDPIDLTPAETAASETRAAWQTAIATATASNEARSRLGDLITSARTDHERTAAQTAEHEALDRLALTLAGGGPNTRKMSLETFVLAAELEEIVTTANRRLRDMSNGRYELRYSDALAGYGAASGLGIVVFDGNTGRERSAHSLSGGETFLSSLALALGLAEVVTSRAGGIHLDTLFIDEGFGSLDADTLNVAMTTLDELRQGGRTVGVISHVEAMQEAIPAQLRVEQTDRGPSVIRT